MESERFAGGLCGQRFGYIGDIEEWGKGLGTEAIQIFCDYVFNNMNIYRLWLECDPENGAVRCYEKNGFKYC